MATVDFDFAMCYKLTQFNEKVEKKHLQSKEKPKNWYFSVLRFAAPPGTIT